MSDGWTRDLVGFHHRPRTTNHAALVRGAALRAAIALEQVHPAPDERDSAAIKAIHAAGHTWGLPPTSGILDEPQQVWMAWVSIYTLAYLAEGEGDGSFNEHAAEEQLRHDFLFYLHTVRQDVARLARGCAAGHPEIKENWLAELHDALVHNCGWSVAELVTHVMSLHRKEFPACGEEDDALIRHVLTYTPNMPPLTVDG